MPEVAAARVAQTLQSTTCLCIAAPFSEAAVAGSFGPFGTRVPYSTSAACSCIFVQSEEAANCGEGMQGRSCLSAQGCSRADRPATIGARRRNEIATVEDAKWADPRGQAECETVRTFQTSAPIPRRFRRLLYPVGFDLINPVEILNQLPFAWHPQNYKYRAQCRGDCSSERR